VVIFVRESIQQYFLFLAGELTLLVQDDPFLGYRAACLQTRSRFYENGLKRGALPVSIDSGHPPAPGYYLAFCWTLFGKSLACQPLGHVSLLYGSIWSCCGESLSRAAGLRWLFSRFQYCSADPGVVHAAYSLLSPDVLVFSGLLLVVHGHFSAGNLARITGVLLSR
jgi:hypothetical protein